MKKPSEKEINRVLETIAKEVGYIDTLETRMSDHLDFYDMSVWCMKAMLRAEFDAGYKAAKGD